MMHGAFPRGQDQTEQGWEGRQTSAAPALCMPSAGLRFRACSGRRDKRKKQDRGRREMGDGGVGRKDREERGPSVGVEDRLPGLEPTRYCLLLVRPWAAYLASWSLRVPICQTGTITVPTSWHCEDSVSNFCKCVVQGCARARFSGSSG